MAEDTQVLWSDEVRARLNEWAAWTRGNQLVRGAQHVLAAMIKKAAGEVPGADTSVGYEFTLEIEAVDKAIARMRLDANQQDRRRKKHIKSAKRVLMSTYLGNKNTREIAEKYDCSEDHVKALLWYAESYVGRLIPDIERDLHARQNQNMIKTV